VLFYNKVSKAGPLTGFFFKGQSVMCPKAHPAGGNHMSSYETIDLQIKNLRGQKYT